MPFQRRLVNRFILSP